MIGCHGNQKAKFVKIKGELIRSYMGGKAETLQKFS